MLRMVSPLTAIPWEFVASFAQEMLSAVTQHGLAMDLYEGYYSSPASCGLNTWWAYYATASSENLVFVALSLANDPGHILASSALS